jgi:hypothetical protein
MESNQPAQQGEQCSAILVSGKLFNDDDGLIWPTPVFMAKAAFSRPLDFVMFPLWS